MVTIELARSFHDPVFANSVSLPRSLVIAPRLVFRCIQMSKRWLWDDYNAYRHTRPSKIREEFRITVRAVA